MYKVTFSDIDRKILRSIKDLKSKSGHTLHEAEKLLKNVHKIASGPTKLTIVISDLDNELEYSFEDISINPNTSTPMLMDIIVDDIIASGHEDSQKLISELEKQYQIEGEEFENTIETRSVRTNKKGFSPKGLNLLGRFKKGLINKNEEKPDNSNDDFKELEVESDDFEAGSTYKPSIQDDFDEMNEYNDDFADFTEFDDIKDQAIEMDSQEEDDDTYSEQFEEEVEEFLPFEIPETDDIDETDKSLDSENMVIEDDYVTEEYSDQIAETSYKKNERVIFPAYDAYLDLSAVNNTIDRNKERLEKTNLVKFLGLNSLSTDTTVTDLNSLKLKYALNKLDGSKFVLLKDYFYNSVENIKDKIQTQLSQAYEQAMTFDYQEEAIKKSMDEVNKLYENGESDFAAYQNDEEEKYRSKLEKFEYEQEKALEEFKKQQDIDKNIFVQGLDAKKSASIGLYKDKMQSELNIKKEKILDEKVFELKYGSINQLTETKRQAIRNFEEQLDSVIDETWVNTQEALIELKNEIESHIPDWKKELEEKRKLESEEREEIRKQEQLELEKQRLELQRKQLEMKTNGNKDNGESIEKLLEKKFSEYDEKINSKVKQLQTESIPQVKQPSEKEHSESNSFSKKKNPMITSAVIGLLAVGSGLFAGQVFANNNSTANAQQVSQYEVLADKMSALEEKINTPLTPPLNQTSEETVTLDQLLKDKNYEKAMSSYKDPKSLKKIEEVLYVNRDLATLITFNKINDTVYGPIDEAVLSKDADKVLELYKNMSDEAKANLTNERKSDIALLLYQINETDLANQLLGIGEK